MKGKTSTAKNRNNQMECIHVEAMVKAKRRCVWKITDAWQGIGRTTHKEGETQREERKSPMSYEVDA